MSCTYHNQLVTTLTSLRNKLYYHTITKGYKLFNIYEYTLQHASLTELSYLVKID